MNIYVGHRGSLYIRCEEIVTRKRNEGNKQPLKIWKAFHICLHLPALGTSVTGVTHTSIMVTM